MFVYLSNLESCLGSVCANVLVSLSCRFKAPLLLTTCRALVRNNIFRTGCLESRSFLRFSSSVMWFQSERLFSALCVLFAGPDGDSEASGCPQFHFMPRFVRFLPGKTPNCSPLTLSPPGGQRSSSPG